MFIGAAHVHAVHTEELPRISEVDALDAADPLQSVADKAPLISSKDVQASSVSPTTNSQVVSMDQNHLQIPQVGDHEDEPSGSSEDCKGPVEDPSIASSGDSTGSSNSGINNSMETSHSSGLGSNPSDTSSSSISSGSSKRSAHTKSAGGTTNEAGRNSSRSRKKSSGSGSISGSKQDTSTKSSSGLSDDLSTASAGSLSPETALLHPPPPAESRPAEAADARGGDAAPGQATGLGQPDGPLCDVNELRKSRRQIRNGVTRVGRMEVRHVRNCITASMALILLKPHQVALPISSCPNYIHLHS